MQDVMNEIRRLGGHGTLEALMVALDSQLDAVTETESNGRLYYYYHY